MKINKILYVLILIMTLNFTVCMAKSNEYIIIDNYEFTLPDKPVSSGYVKVFLGNVNISKYSQGTVKVSPVPDTYEKDKYGNVIAKYFTKNRRNSINVQVTKNITTSEYTKPIEKGMAGVPSLTYYLQPATKIESDNAYIVSKANELIQNCKDDYEKVKNIFAYVNEYMSYDASAEYRNKGALSAMLTSKGVCEEYVSLFVAMCRASGIPARIIKGYNCESLKLNQKADAEPLSHAWAEVYFEGYGWIPSEITAEYVVDGVKQVYWKGFLQLSEPLYALEGVYNPDGNDASWLGAELTKMEKNITFVGSTYFSDIKNYWGKQYVENLYDKDIINGYEDGTFKPQNNVTRIEFMAMLTRSLRYMKKLYYAIDDIYYPDGFVSNWSKEDYDLLMKYYAYNAKDYKKGAGYNTMTRVFGNGTFEMNKAITREEVVALLAPFFKTKGTYKNQLQDIDDSVFKEDIINIYENGIITGYEDFTFKPDQSITRGEISTILDKMTNKE